MKYFLISKTEDNRLALESFEAKDAKDAMLHVVDAWSGFDKGDDYQACKNMSTREIRRYLADMNKMDEAVDLAIFNEGGITKLGEDVPRQPVWSLFDYMDPSDIF